MTSAEEVRVFGRDRRRLQREVLALVAGDRDHPPWIVRRRRRHELHPRRIGLSGDQGPLPVRKFDSTRRDVEPLGRRSRELTLPLNHGHRAQPRGRARKRRHVHLQLLARHYRVRAEVENLPVAPFDVLRVSAKVLVLGRPAEHLARAIGIQRLHQAEGRLPGSRHVLCRGGSGALLEAEIVRVRQRHQRCRRVQVMPPPCFLAES